MSKNIAKIETLLLILINVSKNINTLTKIQSNTRPVTSLSLPKFFPFFNSIKVANSPCLSEIENTFGTCFTKNDCRDVQGVESGSCADGFGVCCVVSMSCDDVMRLNNTIFRNPGGPPGFIPIDHHICTFKIQKPSSSICQIKVNFNSMELSHVNSNGHCDIDNLSIKGTASRQTNLCGPLTAQHLYLEFGSSERITLTISMDGRKSKMNREWNVHISYLECNSIWKAPQGCLQYYKNSFDLVKILGFPMTPHISHLDYTVCIRSEEGVESISWVPCYENGEEQSFYMSNAEPGSICNEDYVIILTADERGQKPYDRYCGKKFKKRSPQLVHSIVKPFILRVHTNGSENEKFNSSSTSAQVGFCLAYKQNIELISN